MVIYNHSAIRNSFIIPFPLPSGGLGWGSGECKKGDDFKPSPFTFRFMCRFRVIPMCENNSDYRFGFIFVHSATGGTMPSSTISSRILQRCS